MRKSLLIPAAAFLGFALSAPAQIGVYIGTPPPPIQYEARPALPYPGAYWVAGYWAPNGRRYRWMRGHYERPPYANAYWTHGHWDHYRNGWHYHEGRWDQDDRHDHRDNDDRDRRGPGRDRD